jgi:3-hydroxybutyryl-CoA dehydratase
MIFTLNEKFEEIFKVSTETYEGFINFSQDKNALHTNEEFAQNLGFEGKVMHGNILNGFISYFIGECLPTNNVIIHSQDIKFKNAVYLNDELQFTAEIVGVYESVNAVEFKYSFKSNGKIMAKGKFQIGLLG